MRPARRDDTHWAPCTPALTRGPCGAPLPAPCRNSQVELKLRPLVRNKELHDTYLRQGETRSWAATVLDVGGASSNETCPTHPHRS